MRQLEHACLQTEDGVAVMLGGVSISGDLRGLVFEACVEQRFSNPTDRNVEVVYTFPLPWGAVLLNVEVVLGDRHLTGAVVDKRRAEARYEEAISEGDAAIMLERNGDHSYSLNLGNLAAREECVVTLRYAQTLQFEQRGLRLLIPTVIAPRYGDAVRKGRLRPHQVAAHSLLAEYPFDLALRLHGDLARARVASPSHPVAFAPGGAEAEGVLTVSLARRGALDRDFVLVVDRLVHDSIAVLARDAVDATAVVALASFCPRIPVPGAPVVAVKLLVDCSGSMGGDSIDAARRSLHAIVAQLGDGDRFSLSRFGSAVEHRSRGLWRVTEATRTAAGRWLDGLAADLGGTEMEAALASTFALAQTVDSDVLLVTDGEISAIDSAIESARASGHRVFVVGIGSSPAETHLRRLAEATGGACDFVAPGEAVEPAVLRMFARLRSPRMTGLAVIWPGEAPAEWISPLPRSVFDGDTVNVFALLRQVPTGDVRLQGRRSPESPLEAVGKVTIASGVDGADTLSRIAAAVRLRSLAATPHPDSAEQEATQLAVAYQLVTDHTSFLLVHPRAEGDKATDMPGLHRVRPMVPAGWGGTGSTLAFCAPVAPYCPSASMPSPQDLCAPPMTRSSRVASAVVLDSIADMDRGVPGSLRGGPDAIDRRNPRYWSAAEHYRGLTPLGFAEWLRQTPGRRWPGAYEELRRLGLGAGVVEWLELTFGERDGAAVPESVVVRAFVTVMSQPEIRESLLESGGVRENIANAAERLTSPLKGKPKAAQPLAEGRLVGDLLAALRDMSAEQWPEQVFALTQ